MIKAVYPGSFDPATNGHLDIIMRSSEIFDKLVVGIGHNYSKSDKSLFSVEERLDLLQRVFKNLGLDKNVELMTFEGLLMDFVIDVGAEVIVRGLRAVSDFEYEFAISQMNKTLNPHIDTVFLMASEQYSFISSALIKEVAKFGGDVSTKIHPIILERLKEKLNTN